jgi:hypothetical protein
MRRPASGPAGEVEVAEANGGVHLAGHREVQAGAVMVCMLEPEDANRGEIATLLISDHGVGLSDTMARSSAKLRAICRTCSGMTCVV